MIQDLNNKEEQATDLEKKEILKQNFNKLSEKLKESLNSRCIISRNPYSPGIGLTNVDDIKNIKSIIDSGNHDDDEYSVPLKKLYSNYIDKLPIGEQYKKYHEPNNDLKTNSITEETIKEASFVLKDFLEDLEKSI